MSEIRTLEELRACDFDDMTYGELCAYFDDCTEMCPLYRIACGGGYACYGGPPVEPPCTSFSDNTVLFDVLLAYCEKERRYEEREARHTEDPKKKRGKEK